MLQFALQCSIFLYFAFVSRKVNEILMLWFLSFEGKDLLLYSVQLPRMELGAVLDK